MHRLVMQDGTRPRMVILQERRNGLDGKWMDTSEADTTGRRLFQDHRKGEATIALVCPAIAAAPLWLNCSDARMMQLRGPLQQFLLRAQHHSIQILLALENSFSLRSLLASLLHLTHSD